MVTVTITHYDLSVYILLMKKDKQGHPAPSDDLPSKAPTVLKLINILTCHILQ